MPLSSLLASAAPLIAATLPAFSLNLAGRLGAACVVLLVGLVAAKLLHLIAPLTDRPPSRVVREGANLIVTLLIFATLAPVGIIAVARATSTAPSATMPHRVRSANFVLYSDLDRAELRRYAQIFEAARHLFAAELHPLRRAQRPLRVHLFSHAADFHRFAHSVGYHEPPLGFCSYADGVAALSLSAHGPPSGLSLALHELGHYLVQAAIGRELPEWIDEGFAAFFEKVVGPMDRGTLAPRLTMGYFDRHRFASVWRQLPRLRLRRLLAGPRARTFAWASAARSLMLFLHHKGCLAELLTGLRAGCDHADCRDVLLGVTGARSVDELEQRWKRWIGARALDPTTPFWGKSVILPPRAWRAWLAGRALSWDPWSRIWRSSQPAIAESRFHK